MTSILNSNIAEIQSIQTYTDQANSEHDSGDDDWMGLFNDISNASDDDEVDYRQMIVEADKDGIVLEAFLKPDINTIIKFIICPTCHVEGRLTGGGVHCEKCGLERKMVDNNQQFCFATEKDHNTSLNSFISFNIVGKNSYAYQRSFLKTCANYSSFRRNNNRKELYNYNYQHEGKKIPKNAIKLAIELFSTIKENNYVYRGNGKKGVLGACLFYACVMNQITKTPREIASVMEIEDRFLSQGDRIVQELNEKGIIEIPTILRPLKDYLDQYFPALNIPLVYKSFVVDIIERAEKKNIHIQNDSRTTTKCIGAIYLLTTRIKKLNHITKDQIVKECNISKSTFIRYFNLLTINHVILKKVFKKHKIPMPNNWKYTMSDKDMLSTISKKNIIKSKKVVPIIRKPKKKTLPQQPISNTALQLNA
jgi:transcription initiation factor TFIIIB Brf1 subunit/transcription initiation factor TFIIB